MRTTLAASMLNAISRNEKQGTLEGRLFEVASIYIPESLPLTSYPDERKVLCVGTFGNNESFFTMKGIANTIAESMDIEFTYEPVQKSFLHHYPARNRIAHHVYQAMRCSRQALWCSEDALRICR